MTTDKRLPVALLLLRLSILIVMLVWTLDKFVRPEHASAVYEHFYLLGGLSEAVMYLIGILELLLLAAFACGYQKRYSYALVLILHGISTLSSFRQYAAPFTDSHLLFFAAWPMLAACFTLFYLRDDDRLWVVG